LYAAILLYEYIKAGHGKFSKSFKYVMGEIKADLVQQGRNKMKARNRLSSQLENRKCFYSVEGNARILDF
jgi:hypothetical protein